ncbi:uncharacterized protein CANTADRAFT_10327 [Suhomyces tanzawaensis NRRL Y-17324]|uniref:Uncharacterized protein n=1 Tax=Suhomyces tanzawaensis NRRL Y-17324 TaxID=984487 RepID=A0A1E4SNX5_9ASCO|nr:uncharacterized protein CANTADRAFT_10327 [Suhomyces tanzawaensis NRRL Y-17324]ODV81213.1 hypothetical protein CANTADRAFT_10327 [Suhomyces tanzawaensis NRRL Y-17324]
MFEDVTFPYIYKEGKIKKLERLELKHVEQRWYYQLCHSKTLTPKQRKVLQSPANKNRILRLIRKDIQEKPKPEETYEIWHDHRNLNTNLRHTKPEKEGEILAKKIVEALDEDEGDDDGEPYEYFEALETWKSYNETFDPSASWVKHHFQVRAQGLETKPVQNYEPSYYYPRYHVNNLKTLLHLSVLRRHWDLAYKIFCILIRIRMVDLRSIWPLGVEIVRQRQALDPAKSSVYKDEKFFDWLSSFYVITNLNAAFNKGHARQLAAPMWRSGSKMRAPVYSVSALWSLLMRGDHSKLRDKLEELLLVPPYNHEGVCYFLMGLCNLMESVELVEGYGDQERAGVVKNLKALQSNWERCEELGFSFPKKYLQQQVNQVLEMAGSTEEIYLGNLGVDLDLHVDVQENDDNSDDDDMRFTTASPPEFIDGGYESAAPDEVPGSPVTFNSPEAPGSGDGDALTNTVDGGLDLDFDFD